MTCAPTHSSVEARLIDPLCDPEWEREVGSHPNATFFHSGAWARVLALSYGHEPVYLRLAVEGRLLALVPVMEVRSCLTGCRGVCLPFTDVCEPLLFAGGTFELVADQLRELARKRNWKHFEIRGGAPNGSAKPSVAFYSHTLDLRAGPERVSAGFEASVHRACRKGEKSGLTVDITQDRKSMLEFYYLHNRTRHRHGVPPQPLSFFLNIYRVIIEPALGFVVIAHRGSRPAAGAIFFQFGKKAIYKFGASDASLQELRGNNLVMDRAIRYLAEFQAETLHFGRTSLSNAGLRGFKRTWGAKEEKLEYFKFDLASATWVTGRDNSSGIHTALFSRLPLALNRFAGNILYPHLD